MSSDQSNHPEKANQQSPSPANDESVVIDAIEVMEKVGEISPAVLIAGVLIGLLVFVMIAGGLIFFILNGGFGLIPTPRSEPLAVDFSDVSGSLWQKSVQSDFVDGGYQISSQSAGRLYWSTAGIDLGLGEYAVDVTFVEQSTNSGAGILFLLSGEAEAESFYLFEIDPNGFAWIGRCEQSCTVANPLTGGGWYSVGAIKTGADETNRLKVEVRGTDMTFFINEVEIGYVPNQQIVGWGDVGLLLEAGDGQKAVVKFDNFVWAPITK